MPDFDQEGRVLVIESDLGKNAMLLEALTGEEGVSRPFRFQLTLLSDSDKVNPKSLLRLPVAVTIAPTDDGERVIHGIVREVVDLGRKDGFTRYRAIVVPWLDFLDDSFDCKIYQEMTVPAIVQKVFEDQGYSDFDIRCTKTYKTREFCVQYRESHMDFVSRLLEDEGIFYFFEHTTSKHMLVLTDDKSLVKTGPQATIPFRHGSTGAYSPTITSLEVHHSTHAGAVVLDDYDPLKASTDLISDAKGDGQEEIYDYPGGFLEEADGKATATVRMEAEEVRKMTLLGSGGAWGLVPGFRFKVDEHYRSEINTEHQVLSVFHAAEQFGVEASDRRAADYSANWTAIPADTPFRPRRVTPRPRIRGAQTAVVVGPSGEEIWVDNYGRIKVQFHWDRVGQFDENSSCWIRVASSWAGKGWGHVKIPRIGQEVVVEFLEGDPDRPLVTGSVYNSDYMQHYELPANGTRSYVKTRSSPNDDGYNELRFEDKAGSEEVYLQAQLDFNTYVKNNCKVVIEHHHTREVNEGDETITLKNGKQVITLENGDRSVTLQSGNETVTLAKGNQTTECQAGEVLIRASDKITFEVGGSTIVMDPTSITMKTQDFTVDASGKVEIKSGMDTVIDAGMNLDAKAGMNAAVEAGMNLDAKAGMNFTAKGSLNATVEGSVMGTFKGGVQGQLEGGAVAIVKGGIVMIN